MPLFEPHGSSLDEELLGSDVATRALSVTAVENDFVEGVYEKLAKGYDYTFGPTLHAGRLQAIQRLGIQAGDKVLEVGVGTGINVSLYPRHCSVTGIDLSESMLEKARARVTRKGLRNVRLLAMDAAALTFASDTYDIVYAPYLISVVPDPVSVAREMRRVCRPGGRIIILNHFHRNDFFFFNRHTVNNLFRYELRRADRRSHDGIAFTLIEQRGAGEAFLPILDALGRLCRGPAGEQVIEILRRHAPMWLVQLPALVAAEELAALQRTVQGATRERMLRELAQALEVLTADQPLLLVLEDLHWSDGSTLDLLAFLARRRDPARLLVLGTYRPVEMLSEGHPLKGVVQELYAHALGRELPVGVLGEEAIAQYLDGRFAGGAPQATRHQSLARMFHQRTGGNPLFLVSLVEDLVIQGAFVQTHDGWRLQEETAAERIPESIRHLVARQRERLAPVEQTLLEAASVAGMEFSAAAVAAALARDTTAVERHCEHLATRQQFLRRLGVEEWPDGTLAARFGFQHALYQQLWHEQVSPTQLQRYHLRIGTERARVWRTGARDCRRTGCAF